MGFYIFSLKETLLRSPIVSCSILSITNKNQLPPNRTRKPLVRFDLLLRGFKTWPPLEGVDELEGFSRGSRGETWLLIHLGQSSKIKDIFSSFIPPELPTNQRTLNSSLNLSKNLANHHSSAYAILLF
jgi:hypothetical protein